MINTELIRLENIKKEYTGGEKFTALNGININIERGEFIGITGQSGSGKTTLINIIGCLDNDFSGNYYFDGKLLSEFKNSSLCRLRNNNIGYIFQSYNLIPSLTVMENVTLPLIYRKIPKAERTERANRVLHNVGLYEKKNRLPSELSGGQRQRVAVARAAVLSPKLILADEPTGSLDSQMSERIVDLLWGLKYTGSTVIMVTHNNDMSKKCDRVINLNGGVYTN